MQRPQHETGVPVVHTTASGKPVTAAEAVQGATATTPTAVLLPEAATTTTASSSPASSTPTTPAAGTAGAAPQQQHPEGAGPASGIKHALTGFAEKIGLKVRGWEEKQREREIREKRRARR